MRPSVFCSLDLANHHQSILGGLRIESLPSACLGKARLLIQLDGGGVGDPHLQGDGFQLGILGVAEQSAGDGGAVALPSMIGMNGDVGDLPLVHRDEHTAVSGHGGLAAGRGGDGEQVAHADALVGEQREVAGTNAVEVDQEGAADIPTRWP